MATLYEITGAWLQVYQMADEPWDGEDREDGEAIDPDVWFDTMEAIEGELEIKADGYARLFKNFMAISAAHKKEAERQKAAADAWENKAKRIKQRLFEAMTTTGKTEIPNDLFKIKIVRNGGLAPLEFIEGQEVPEEYQKITVENDNTKIREALKNGALPFAKLGERGTRLDIK